MPFDMLLYSFPIDNQDFKEIDIRGYEECCDEDGYIRTVSGQYLYDCKVYDIKDFYFSEIKTKAEIIDKDGERHRTPLFLAKNLSILYISPADIYTNRILSTSLYKGMLVEEKRRLLELLELKQVYSMDVR